MNITRKIFCYLLSLLMTISAIGISTNVVFADESDSTIEIEEIVLYDSVNMSDSNDLNVILNDSDLPSEVKDSISQKYGLIKSLGIEENVCVTVLTDLDSAEVSNNNEGVSICGESTSYKTYNGMKMKNYQVSYTGLSTGYVTVKSGTGTSAYASEIFNILMTLGSCKVSTINLFSLPVSLMQSFYNACANFVVTRNTKDYIQMDITYNLIDQWTYGMVGSTYQVGLYTQKVTIKEVNIKQYYYNANTQTGKSHTQSKTGLNKVLESKDFASPWAMTYTYAGSPWHEPISAKWGTKTFYF